MLRTIRRTAAACFTVALAGAALASPASAGIITQSETDCDDNPLVKPFAPWGDRASYRLVPGGDFESAAAGWQLSGGARVAAGNESFNVTSSSDARSLVLPQGSRAVSPVVCVGLGEPTLRLFAKRNSGLLTTLLVEVQVQTRLGLSAWLPVLPGDIGGSRWHPTMAMPILVNLLPLLPGDRTPVRFRFSPLLFGSWQVDDVYVDPLRMR
jgi:hypothetical protein